MSVTQPRAMATPVQLQAALDGLLSVYVLVDPILGEPLPLVMDQPRDLADLQAAREATWNREITTVPLDPGVSLAPHLYPYIVTLQGAEDPRLTDTLEIAHSERADAQADGLMASRDVPHRLAWLQTSLFAQDLAAVLTPMLRVNTQAWTRARYMRLADRRVLDWLRHVVGDARVAAQFGRIRHWIYLDAYGQLAQLANSNDEIQALRLSAEEWKRAMLGEQAHRVAARWLGELALTDTGEVLVPPIRSADDYRRIERALDQAAQIALQWPARFASTRDQAAWAALSLLHPGLENDTRIRAVLQAQPEEGEPAETLHTLSGALRTLTTSYALRLLRAGFVHVYLESPPPGVKNWLIYRVTDNADLIEQNNPVFAQMPQPQACARKEHNAAGMRLLHIPQAHKIDSVWIAYSANLWNDKLQKANAANPKVMQQISLAGGSPNTFKPTAKALKEKVLECALMNLSINKSKEQDFQFNTLAPIAQSVADNLVKAASCHPKTKDKELAVVLRDPVGLAAELNALRLRRQEVSDQYQMQPENRQPMEVNKAIELFKASLIADLDERSMDEVSPVMTKGAYEDIMRVKPNPRGWPEGTQWDPIKDKVELLKRGPGKGRVTFPDQPERANAWVQKQTAATWSRMDKYYDEGQRTAWKQEFAQRMESMHLKELKRFEADWGAALAGGVLSYFATHFDEKDKNDPIEVGRRGCCAGQVYCREAWLAYSPAPLTNACDNLFEQQLDADIQQDSAVMLRAVLANHASLWEQLTADSGDGDGKRDKIYDFMKGLIGEAKTQLTQGGDEPLGAGAAKRLAWVGNVTLGYSMGITSTLAAAAMQSATAAIERAKGTPLKPQVLARLSIAQSMALIHRASEEALAASLAGRRPNAPVFFVAYFDPDTAQQIMKGRGQPINKKTRREWAEKGRVAIGIYSDADTVARLNVKPEIATRELAIQASQVHLQEQAPAFKKGLGSVAAAGSVLVMPVDKFMGIFEAHRKEAMRAPSLVMGSLKQGVMSLDGRLAVGSMIAQGLGIVHGLANYSKAKEEGDAQKVLDAQLSLADGAAGFLGGSLELAGVVWEARLMASVGEAGTKASPLLSFVRGMAYAAGAAGNAVNAWMTFRAAAVQEEKGNRELADWMNRAGTLYSVGGGVLLILALHSIAETAVKRGLIWGAGEAMVARVGTTLATRALFLSVPGWGWLLTGVAVGHTVYVAMVTPTPIQQWLKGCYFGKPDAGVARRGSWAAEEEALKKMQEDALTDAEKQQKLNARLPETTRA